MISPRFRRTCRIPRVLIAFAGAALPLVASAQDFRGLGLPADTLELRPIGIDGNGDNAVICFKAISEKGVQVVETAGLWHAGDFYDIPEQVGPGGEYYDTEILQFRQSGDEGPLDPLKGISVGVVKKPSPQALLWDTRAGLPGVASDLLNSFSATSWATSASRDGAYIGGATFGDLDGAGPQQLSRHATIWRGGAAEMLPVPAGTLASEVWAVSEHGDFAYGAISEQGMSSDQPKMKPATSKGIVWNLAAGGGYSVIDAAVAGPDATALALTGLSGNGALALATINSTRSNTKGGLIAVQGGSFTPLDGGDLNGDGLIDFFDDHDSSANALSADGSIVGGSITVGGIESAAIWLRDAGGAYEYYDLAAYFGSIGSTGQDGWTLAAITGVSPDGLTITGWGVNPLGQIDGWVANIPAPGTFAVIGAAGLLAARRRVRA